MGPTQANYDEKAAIGEIRALVFALRPGQVEVRVRYPRAALPGQAGARDKQDEFHRLVLDELQKALTTFRRHG